MKKDLDIRSANRRRIIPLIILIVIALTIVSLVMFPFSGGIWNHSLSAGIITVAPFGGAILAVANLLFASKHNTTLHSKSGYK